MYFQPFRGVSIAAILSTALAAPAIPPNTDHLCILDTVTIPCQEFRRSAAPAPATVTAPKLPTITACHVPELGGPINCADGGGYLKRSVDDDKDSIVIGSKKRSPQPKLPTIEEDNTTYGVDEEWPVDEDWPLDDGYGEDESWPVDDEDYEKRSLIHDLLPTGDDEGYLRRIKTKRSPTWKEGTCGPEEDAACYPDGSNGKRSPEEPAEDVGAYDEEDGVPFKRSPMWDEKTCGPEEDLACYPDGSNGKNKRALSLDPEGAPIITGDNYPPTKRERPVDTHYPGADKGKYSGEKRAPASKPVPKPKQPIDGDYPVPNDDSYPVRRDPRPPLDIGDYAPPNDDGFYDAVKREPEPLLDAGDYAPPDVSVPLPAKAK